MPRALVLYHYFFPDDVVSAVHMAELCEGLAERGWEITAMPCNRSCREEGLSFPASERWRNIEIRRVWRPALRQSSGMGRLLNAAWMISRWSIAALRKKNAPQALVIGTDPVLSLIVARVWKWLRPEVRIAHWCFDLYPEAALAEGTLRANSPMLKLAQTLLRPAYNCCDLIADIGSCMRSRLESYPSGARRTTMTPWALAEPAHPLPIHAGARRNIFGNARLALLYSGNFGRAHSFRTLLDLAGILEPAGGTLAFSVRGNRVRDLKDAARLHANVLFVPYASSAALEARLSAADIHVVSLREEWTGAVVPSKFFGALAVGRPLIFAGSPESAIAKWITEHCVGWVLTLQNLESVAQELAELSLSRDVLIRMFRHCHHVYQQNFSRLRVTDQWNRELRQMLRVEVDPARARAAGA
jgi:glycosyltransferase involved in cell wall biosynthesis